MFSFLKSSSSNGLKYETKLIKKFTADHKKLEITISKILENLESNKEKKAKKFLEQLKTEMLNHFMEEDIKLYRYLKKYYADSSETLSVVKNFESSLKTIQKDAINFLDNYTQASQTLDDSFKEEFQDIIEALKSRIEKEENKLYTLYKK
jgi:hemerythrin-like domain-containing protein